jgi:FkbM family methyltransferase
MALSTRIRRELERLAADFPGEGEALLRRGFWRLAARYTPVLAVEREGMRLFVATDDDVLGRRLFVYNRTPEQDIRDAVATLAHVPSLASGLAGCSIVEIGANIGSHTVGLIKHYGAREIVAIEPSPANCALVRQNIAANGVADRVTLLELALSDQDGSVSLEISSDNSGDHRVRVGSGATDGVEARRDTIEVRAARFDSLVETGEIALDQLGLVWLDAQGHEGQILAGARSLLASGVPVMMEYWP